MGKERLNKVERRKAKNRKAQQQFEERLAAQMARENVPATPAELKRYVKALRSQYGLEGK